MTAKSPALVWAGLNWTAVAALSLLLVDGLIWSKAGFSAPFGADYHLYRDAAASWLAGTGYYHPDQFVPYDVWSQMPILYPPVTLILFVPFVYLPSILWWSPILIVGWTLRRVRGWRLVLVLGLVLWPPTLLAVWVGNPNLWILAFVALRLGPLVLLKPTLAPFALAGFRSRRWWVALAILVVACLPWDWGEYLTVIGNARNNGGLLYSLAAFPMMLIPYAADT